MKLDRLILFPNLERIVMTKIVIAVLLSSITAAGQTAKVIPTGATAQLVLDPVQARYPGNEHVKPCGPTNHDNACVDESLPHITNHLYGKRGTCELNEGCREVGDARYPISQAAFRSLAAYATGWGFITILMFIPAGWLIQSGLEVEHITWLSVSKVLSGISLMGGAALLYAHALFTIAERILYET